MPIQSKSSENNATDERIGICYTFFTKIERGSVSFVFKIVAALLYTQIKCSISAIKSILVRKIFNAIQKGILYKLFGLELWLKSFLLCSIRSSIVN